MDVQSKKEKTWAIRTLWGEVTGRGKGGGGGPKGWGGVLILGESQAFGSNWGEGGAS